MATVPWSIGRDLIERRRAAGPAPARRSLYACGLLVLGYFLAARVAPGVGSTWWLMVAPGLMAGAVLLRGRACRAAMCAALVAFGAGWYAARINERGAASVAWAVSDEADALGVQPALATVQGVVMDTPHALDRPRGALGHVMVQEPAFGFTLALSGIQTDPGGGITPASGEVRVRVGGDGAHVPGPLCAGAAVRLTGRLRPVRPASNPGEPDWLALAAQEGRIGDMSVPSAELLGFRRPEGWREQARAWWHGALGRLHARCERAVFPADAPSTAPVMKQSSSRALLGALLLGERDAALDEVNSAFTRLGLVHLVAISGFNLAIMAGTVMFLLRLTGDRGWLEPACVAVLVGLYMLVLPAQAPILRAGLLVLVLLIADAAGRRYDRATLLGWIALILLIVRPLDAWSLGFQLSFGIVAALLLLGDTVHHRLWGVPILGLVHEHEPHGRAALWGMGGWIPAVWRLLTRAMKAQISASILAWGVSLPIIAWHTGQISLLTPVMSLIVLPLTVVVLWGGYIALLLGALVPAAAGLTGGTLDLLARLLVDVVMFLDRVPGSSLLLPKVSPWWSLAAVAGVVYLVVRGTLRDRRTWAIAGVLAAWLGAELYAGTRLPRGVEFRIDTLAVGDGSCHLIRHGSECVLWDCGSLTAGLGERLIPQALRELGVRRVPTVIVTHGHIDHFAALPEVVGPLGVERVFVPPQLHRKASEDPASPPGALLADLKARGVEVSTLSLGDGTRFVGLHTSILWPPADRLFRNPNDTSIVAMIDVPAGAGVARRVLMTGDAAREALANLLPDGDGSRATPGLAPSGSDDMRADILELPHHGAFIEPAVELVRIVDPRIVLQSTGPRRAADGRWADVLAGRVWYATPRQGAAWVEIHTDGSITSGSFR